MNILQILQLIATLLPPVAGIINALQTAIHTAPGTPEHTAAVTATIPLPPSNAPYELPEAPNILEQGNIVKVPTPKSKSDKPVN